MRITLLCDREWLQFFPLLHKVTNPYSVLVLLASIQLCAHDRAYPTVY